MAQSWYKPKPEEITAGSIYFCETVVTDAGQKTWLLCKVLTPPKQPKVPTKVEVVFLASDDSCVWVETERLYSTAAEAA